MNIEEAPDLATEYHVRSVPSLLGFRDGAVVLSETGFRGEARLRKLLDRLTG